MTRLPVLLGLVAGFMTFPIVLGALAHFWAEDRCMDLGGAVIDGLCHSPAGIEPLSYSFAALGWMISLVLSLVPAVVVYGVIRFLFSTVRGRRAAEPPGSC